jgi:nucleoside-diphosphate-sugar epimerase
MRVTIIGGSGHIGSYLTPLLVESGHDVTSVSRSRREPYVRHRAWEDVQRFTMDRVSAEAVGAFGKSIAALRPEVVIDLTCYSLESARQLVDALRGHVERFLHCGTIWVHGPGVEVPIAEEQPRKPISEYGRQKAAIEAYLLGQDFPAAVLHPGHLVGPGWMPLNPAANFNPRVFEDLMHGEEIALPNFGRETLHHVHAEDVAQAFGKAMEHWSRAAGESFHVVSPAAVTMIGYAEAVASWYGKEARVRFLPWEEWRRSVSEREAQITWDHIARSPNCSIAKAQRLLDYRPRYRSLDAIREAVSQLFAAPQAAA